MKAQRRRRRLRFWIGFVAILFIGSLWAGLSRDPLPEEDVFVGLLAVGGVSNLGARRATRTPATRRRVGSFGRRAAAVSFAALVVGAIVAAAPASAQERQDGDGEERESSDVAEIDISILGRVSGDEFNRVAAEVSLETIRAVSGRLIVTSTARDQPPTVYEFDVDLAANTTASFPLQLSAGWDGLQTRAVLEADGEVITSKELQERNVGFGGPSGRPIAVLGVDDPPANIGELGSDTDVPVIVMRDDLFGLESVSSLVATPAAIADIEADDELSSRFEGWVRGGGQVVVDGPSESLDERFHRLVSANPDRYFYGAGTVVYQADWRDGIPLGGYQGVQGMDQLVRQQGMGLGASGELGILAGVSLPGVALIGGLLLLYSILAGPMLFGFASVGARQHRIWLLLPALSLLFVGVIVGVGFISRSGASEAHISILEVNETGSRATTNLLLQSRFGADREIDVPKGWSYLGPAGRAGQRPVRLRVGSSSTAVKYEIPPGGAAMARVVGPVPAFDETVVIDDIRQVGDELQARVTNKGTFDLTEVVAFAGTHRVKVDDLPAGGDITITVPVEAGPTSTMQELLLWPRVEQRWTSLGEVAVPSDEDAVTAAGAWAQWRVEQGSSASPENVLGVAGWTDDLASPIGGIETGRTAVFARANIPSGALDTDGHVTAIRLSDHRQEPPGQFADLGYPQDYLVTLGQGNDGTDMAVALERGSSALAFRIEEDWRFVELSGLGAESVAVPADAVVDGQFRFRSYESWDWGAQGVTARAVVDASASDLEFTDRPVARGGAGPDFGEEVLELDTSVPTGVETLVDITVEPAVGEIYTHSETVFGIGANVYSVDLAAGQTVAVDKTAPNGDAYLELFGPTGEFLMADDDSGRGLDAAMSFDVEEDGTYQIFAVSRSSVSLFYDIQIEVIE